MRTQRFFHWGLEGNSPKPWASMGKSMNIDGDFPAMFDFRVEQLRIWVYIRHFEDGMWFRKNCSEKKSFAPGAGVHQLQLALAEMRSFSIQSSHEVRGSPVDLFIFGDPWNPLDTQCRRLFKSSLWTPKSSHEISGWWFQPLWKIWVRQLGLLFPTYGKIKNCSKPPTRYGFVTGVPPIPMDPAIMETTSPFWGPHVQTHPLSLVHFSKIVIP